MKRLHVDMEQKLKEVQVQAAVKQHAHEQLESEVTRLQKKTTTKTATTPAPDETEIHYFRGWKNVLSAHHPCPIKIGSNTFKSKEHAYCFEKLTAHGKKKEAETAKKIRHAGKVKSYTHSIIPEPSREWKAKKGEVMRNIVIKRAQQSAKFRNSLKGTKNNHLVHNMENDSSWGFGVDGKGTNLMGTILEEVRDLLTRNEITIEEAGQSQSQPPHQQPTTAVGDPDPDIIIISDSMLRGVHNYIDKESIDLHVLSGGTVEHVQETLGELLRNKQPKAVVIHVGTNDVEYATLNEMKAAYHNIVKDILFYTGGTKILLSGIIHRLDKTHMNNRIDTINSLIEEMQTETVLFADHNPTLNNLPNVLNRGGLHMTNRGIKQVAENITLTLTAQGSVSKPNKHQSAMKGNRNSQGVWSQQKRKPASNTRRREQELPLHNRFQPLADENQAKASKPTQLEVPSQQQSGTRNAVREQPQHDPQPALSSTTHKQLNPEPQQQPQMHRQHTPLAEAPNSSNPNGSYSTTKQPPCLPPHQANSNNRETEEAANMKDIYTLVQTTLSFLKENLGKSGPDTVGQEAIAAPVRSANLGHESLAQHWPTWSLQPNGGPILNQHPPGAWVPNHGTTPLAIPTTNPSALQATIPQMYNTTTNHPIWQPLQIKTWPTGPWGQ